MDKTLKMPAYSSATNDKAPQDNSAGEKGKTLDLAMKDAQIEEERSRSLEHLKTIVQLRESLKQEQARSSESAKKADEFEAKVKALAGLEAGEVAAKNAQLDAEKSKSLEYQKIIEQLRESLKQEQAKVAALSKNAGEQDAMAKELAELQEKVKEIPALEARVKEIPALEAKVNEIPALEARIGELSALEGKLQSMAALEARVAELSDALGKISAIAAAGKAA